MSYRLPIAIVLSLVGAVFASLAFALMARAHDPHPNWMQNDRYKNTPSGQHCCSANRDCRPVRDEDIQMMPGGGWQYRPTGELIPDVNVFPSRDGTNWRCAFPHGPTRCLFVSRAV